MARTKDPHMATVRAWESRLRAQGGSRVETVQQRGDWAAGGRGGPNAHGVASPLSYKGKTMYSPSVKAAAEKAHARAAANEPEASAAVLAAQAASGGTLVGWDHRLKSAEGIANKAIRDAVEKNIEPEDTIDDLSDLNRYTLTFPPSELVARTALAQKALADAGWEPYDTKAKNFYPPGDAYDGYNTVYVNKNTGARMELQFHTPESVKIKDEAHRIYEKWRELPRSEHEARKRMWDTMTGLWERYERPKNYERLPGKLIEARGMPD